MLGAQLGVRAPKLGHSNQSLTYLNKFLQLHTEVFLRFCKCHKWWVNNMDGHFSNCFLNRYILVLLPCGV